MCFDADSSLHVQTYIQDSESPQVFALTYRKPSGPVVDPKAHRVKNLDPASKMASEYSFLQLPLCMLLLGAWLFCWPQVNRVNHLTRRVRANGGTYQPLLMLIIVVLLQKTDGILHSRQRTSGNTHDLLLVRIILLAGSRM